MRNPPLSPRNQIAAFTLVELLVVIGIIGILAALSIAGIGKMIEKAHAAECISDLGQIRMAMMNFVMDHNGELPRPTIKAASPEGIEMGLTADYMWSKQLGLYLPQRGSSLTAPQNAVFVCPSAKFKGFSKSTTSSTYMCSSALYYFPENASPTHTGYATSGPARRFVTLKNLSQTILVTEGKQSGTSGSCTSSKNWPAISTDLDASEPSGTDSLDFRHSDSIHLLFADGHVSAVPFKERQTEITRPAWEGRFD